MARSQVISHEEGIKLKHYGTDVYHTNSLILLLKNMLRSKNHSHRVWIESSFHARSEGV